MKKISTLAIMAFLFVFGYSVNAQQDTPNSLLWEVSGNGLQDPSYLFGTFHMMCEEDFSIRPKVLAALQKTKSLFLEVNYSDPAELAALQGMMQSGKKLSEQLSAKKAEELNAVLLGYGLTLSQVDQFSPAALYSLIGQKAITCSPQKVKLLDVEIMKLALAQQKNIKGLETVAAQAQVLEKAYGLDESIEQLAKGDKYSAIFKKMITAYKEENLIELDRLVKDREFMNADQERWMLSERNNNWVKEMPGYMEKESSFFAFGGGHLLGKNGIIQLLRAKGYTVKPVL